jgi:hypothetical protein
VFQQNVFPDPGTVYDYYFVKQASGSWGEWMDYVDKKKLEIPKNAKVVYCNGRDVNSVLFRLIKSSLYWSNARPQDLVED